MKWQLLRLCLISQVILLCVGCITTTLTPFQGFLKQTIEELNNRDLSVNSVEVNHSMRGIAFKDGNLRVKWPVQWGNNFCKKEEIKPEFLFHLIDGLENYDLQVNSFEFKNGSVQLKFANNHLVYYLPFDSCVMSTDLDLSNRELLHSIETLQAFDLHVSAFHFNPRSGTFNFLNGQLY